jgi:type I restriction enzyme M protein
MAAWETIKKSLDALRTDPGINGEAEQIAQLSWMLFLKILDDREIVKERAQEGYHSPIPDELRWHRWADGSERTGSELLTFVDNTLFRGLRDLSSTDPLTRLVRDVFMDADNHLTTSPPLRQSIHWLNEIDFGDPTNERDIGEAFEHLLSDLRGTTGAGEYYTPRAVIQFMIERVDPKLGETVLDPACGTGGFLVGAVEHLRDAYGPEKSDVIERSIRGIEKNALPHLLCVINMILHGIDVPTEIRRATALGFPIRAHIAKWPVDVILTTPPFGGLEEEGLRKHFPAAFWTRETAELFLYRIITFLRPGGRAAIVVPDGLLEGRGVTTRIKEMLLAECNLHTIVRLPGGVFSPYTDVETNILFLTKGESTKEVWYYEHTSPPGYFGYSTVRPLRPEDFAAERAWWSEREETRQAWRVSIKEINARDSNLDLRWLARDTGQASWRLASLRLHGFRGFSSLDLALPAEGSAVLIGVNGAGKSTVLEAMAILLSSFTALTSGLSPGEADIQIGEADIKAGHEAAAVGVTVRVGDEEQEWELRASPSHVAAPSEKEISQAGALRDQLLRFETASLPVLCFYSAGRGIGDDGGGKPGSRSSPQLDAYEHAFRRGVGSFQDFVRWFRDEEGLENQVRLRKDPAYRNPRLQLVRKALQCFLDALGVARFSDMRIERSGEEKEGTLVIEKDGVPLRIEQLSEGEKNTLLLVCDVARRLAIANPAAEDALQSGGIVLIDEIDLHLHPAWQRGLLPALSATFPRCQIIASTHSPQVLSRIPRENVFILEDFALVRVTPYTYGRDSNSILGEVFGVPERPADMEEKIHQAAVLLDEERIDEAKMALDELLSILGEHDAELVRLKTMMSFLERPVRD